MPLMSLSNKPDTQILEDAFVAQHFAPLARGFDGAIGLRDDAALLSPREGMAFVVSTDCLVSGCHFVLDESAGNARDIGFRALACNVSDLVAKGAEPYTYQLSLSLPQHLSSDWVGAFAEGLRSGQDKWGLSLSGGDTVRGCRDLVISITAIGVLPQDEIVRRSGARIGDAIVVTGTIGDALAGLKVVRGDDDVTRWRELISPQVLADLSQFYWRPSPPVDLIKPLRDCASAALDISDGLVIDLTRLCSASGVGATVDVLSLPLSPAVRTLIGAAQLRIEDVITAGDDYQVLASLPQAHLSTFLAAAQRAGVLVAVVGKIQPGADVVVRGDNGQDLTLTRRGWDHFND